VVTLQQKGLTRNKRGSLSDYPSIIIMIFGGATVLIIAAMLITNIKSGFSAAGLDVAAFNDLEAVWTTFDYSMSFLIIAFMGATVIGAAYVDTSPVFFVFSVLLLGITILVASQISNVFAAVATSGELSVAAGSFPISVWIMANLPVILLGGAVLTTIVLYAKLRSPL
tara:strand:+ start:417 stop:920 length:504 start_codon:yes stop_codon:yes gene_type:complete